MIGLKTYFYQDGQVIKAVDGVDMEIGQAEVVGLVGESGCGKSVTALSITRLIPSPGGEIVSGEICFQGRDVLKLDEDEIRKIRGRDISYIFQEPTTSLNPVFTIGNQIIEAIQLHQKKSGKEARLTALKLLKLVEIPSPEERLDSYPHQLSGGMKQRVMIAMAISSNPRLLIADEPTTALDVTIQAQILELLKELKIKTGVSILLITHDLSIVFQLADKVAVMYMGKIVEYCDAKRLYANPVHPYTRGLLNCVSWIVKPKTKLSAIPGNVPNPGELYWGCNFHPRCEEVFGLCKKKEPEMIEIEKGHFVRCFKTNKETS